MPYFVYFKTSTTEEQHIEVEHYWDASPPRVYQAIADHLSCVPLIPSTARGDTQNIPTTEGLYTKWAEEEGIVITKVEFITPT